MLIQELLQERIDLETLGGSIKIDTKGEACKADQVFTGGFEGHDSYKRLKHAAVHSRIQSDGVRCESVQISDRCEWDFISPAFTKKRYLGSARLDSAAIAFSPELKNIII